MASFEGNVHKQGELEEGYDFVQVFGASNEELQSYAKSAERHVKDDGLFWRSTPKNHLKLTRGRTAAGKLSCIYWADEGYEPVRQIAIDEDWSALRFRKTGKIKTMTRSFLLRKRGYNVPRSNDNMI